MNPVKFQVTVSGSLKSEFSENVEVSGSESYSAALSRILRKCQENVNAVLTDVIENPGAFEISGATQNNLTMDPDTVDESLPSSDSDNKVINVPQIQGHNVTLPTTSNLNDSVSSTLTATCTEIPPENEKNTQGKCGVLD